MFKNRPTKRSGIIENKYNGTQHRKQKENIKNKDKKNCWKIFRNSVFIQNCSSTPFLVRMNLGAAELLTKLIY